MFDISLENITGLTYVLVFLVGILMCFTPCVYPIIPVVAGYIGGAETKTRKEAFVRSLSYVFGVALVYSVLGAAVAFSGGIFGRFQSSFWVNIIVANVFIIMGLFMLDVFQMPQLSFTQRLMPKNKAGVLGAFLLGAVSGMVLGPCTTPVLGGILAYVAAKHNVVLGVSLLFTYALGMGFPLLVLGTFIGLLKKMPKSGPWMLKIKKIFGILLIASGEYFLIHMR
ncbi:MAG: cytochrome c biogenesis protein CcdA [Candidatus Omnitrophota bacterium]